MTALRASDIDRFLSRPDPRRPVALIYGPDSGLVSERAQSLIRTAAGENADPLSIVSLEGDAVAADPGLLIDEAQSIGLFGSGRRVIRVRAGNKNFAPAVEALLENPPQATVVIEAGELRPSSPLRAICEKSPAAAAIPCYVDAERDLARLIAESKLTFEPGAKEELMALLGADRLASRGEIEKLALYVKNGRVTVADVRAAIADASALELDEIVDAAAAGDTESTLAALARARSAGTQPSAILNAAIRHVANLHRLSLAIEKGESPSRVVEYAKPPIFFRRKPRFERALARYGADQLAHELVSLSDTALEARKHPPLAESLTERAMLRLARGGKQAGRKG